MFGAWCGARECFPLAGVDVGRARRLGAFRSDLRAWRVRARGAFGARFHSVDCLARWTIGAGVLLVIVLVFPARD